MYSIIVFSINNRFAIRSTISNGGQRGWGGVWEVTVNGIGREYIDVIDHRKVKAGSNEVGCQHEKREKETPRKQVCKRKIE